MEILLWIRFILGTLFLLAGMVLFVVEIISVFKLDYVLNRMHAAATGDTSGIGLSLIGLMILNGFNLITLKLLLVVSPKFLVICKELDRLCLYSIQHH